MTTVLKKTPRVHKELLDASLQIVTNTWGVIRTGKIVPMSYMNTLRLSRVTNDTRLESIKAGSKPENPGS